jgi:hypothetical protein
MASLFMSFIHDEVQEATFVRRFIHNALSSPVDSFMSSDRSAIYAGEDWMARIFKELEETKVLVSMLSPVSVSKPWINFEAGAAWMNKKVVIPACIGGLTVGNLPKPYSSLQALDVETFDGMYYLVSSVAHHLGLPEPARPVFSDKPEPFLLGSMSEDDNARLFAPYKNLKSFFKANNLLKTLTTPSS